MTLVSLPVSIQMNPAASRGSIPSFLVKGALPNVPQVSDRRNAVHFHVRLHESVLRSSVIVLSHLSV